MLIGNSSPASLTMSVAEERYMCLHRFYRRAIAYTRESGCRRQFSERAAKVRVVTNVCDNTGHSQTLNILKDYDRSYFFIARFIVDNIAHSLRSLASWSGFTTGISYAYVRRLKMPIDWPVGPSRASDATLAPLSNSISRSILMCGVSPSINVHISMPE